MDIKNQYEFFKNVKLTEDGYLIVSGAGGGTPEEVDITINGNVYKSVEAPNTENIIVKDDKGNTVGSLIGGEWIVPSGSAPIATPTYFPLRNTATNPVNGNTGNTGQSINGQSYTFVPNDGLYFDSPPTNFNNLLNYSGSGINDSDIGLWDVSNIIYMSAVFQFASSFNQDIGNWDVSNVLGMNNMFNGASSFNRDIGNWDVSNVTRMDNMFYNATSFNRDIGNWNVSNAGNMSRMFSGTPFNQDIGGWNVSNVTNMDIMFYNASSFNQDLSGWCVTNITTEPNLFSTGSALSPANKPVWGTCP